MKLSTIIAQMDQSLVYKIFNEKEFDYLALTAQKINYKTCTFLDNSKYSNELNDNVTMVLTTNEIACELHESFFGICVVDNPRLLFFDLHNYLSMMKGYKRDTYETIIGKHCSISPQTCISKNNVKIGNNVIIEEFVSIKENTVIGNNTIIRAGSIIGGQGFEFKRTKKGVKSVLHIGGVKIGENVEIQYNTCIDKAVYPWDDTEVGNNSKIDNLVYIGHAAKIKENVMIVAHSGVGGRTIINPGSWIGFGAILKNGLNIGDNARTNMGAIVTKDVDDNQSVTGNFAVNHSDFIKELKERKKTWNSEI